MQNKNIAQLKILAEIFDTDKIITPSEIEMVLKGILQIMNSFKKSNEDLNKETKQTVKDMLGKVMLVSEHNDIVSRVTSENKNFSADFDKKIAEIKSLMQEVEEMKPMDGKDCDEDRIIDEVLKKMPEHKEMMIEGEDIVDKINALNIDPENQIDAKHIKNLPEFKGKFVGGGSTARNLYQLMDVVISTPTNNQVLKYNGTTNVWENGIGGGGIALTDLSAGTGISYNNLTGVITNSAPDQIVALTAGTNIDSITGTYPNFTINASTQGGSYTLPTATDSILGGIKVGARLTITDGVLSADVQAGGGDVLKVGTPLNTQVGYWTGDGTLAGDAGMTYNATTNVLTATGFVGALTGNADTVTNGVYTTGAGTVFEVPLTFGDGLTRTLNDIDLDTTLNILKISGLTSNGFVKTSGGDGTLSVDTNTYLTSLSGAVLTDQTVGQTIGLTGARLTKLWATDIEVTNAIAGSVTGNAGTVTGATFTTALTVNTGTVTLTGNVANSSILTIGAGAVSVSGSNTGDQTTILGNAGSATILETTRTIWGQNFNGSANVTGDITLGASSITMTGSIGATGARVTKGWFTDIESTNMPTVGGTALSSTFAPIASPTFTGIVTTPAIKITTGAGANKVLTSDADGDATWETPTSGAFSGASVGISGNTTTTPIPFDTEQIDTDSYHDNTTNNTRLTIPTTGYYLVTADIPFVPDGGYAVNIQLRKNGSTIIGTSGAQSNSAGPVNGLSLSGIFSLTATDYLEIIFNKSGGTHTFQTVGTSFCIQKVG